MASIIAPKMAFRALRAAPRAAPWASLNAKLPQAQPAFRRFFAAPAQEQPRLRLGSTGMATMGIYVNAMLKPFGSS